MYLIYLVVSPVNWKLSRQVNCSSLVTNPFPNVSLPMLREMNRSIVWSSGQRVLIKGIFHSFKGCSYHVFCFISQQLIGLARHQDSMWWLTDCINVLKTINMFKVKKGCNISTVYWSRYALINPVHSSPPTICTCETCFSLSRNSLTLKLTGLKIKWALVNLFDTTICFTLIKPLPNFYYLRDQLKQPFQIREHGLQCNRICANYCVIFNLKAL
jgi:hypothetical protein